MAFYNKRGVEETECDINKWMNKKCNMNNNVDFKKSELIYDWIISITFNYQNNFII